MAVGRGGAACALAGEPRALPTKNEQSSNANVTDHADRAQHASTHQRSRSRQAPRKHCKSLFPPHLHYKDAVRRRGSITNTPIATAEGCLVQQPALSEVALPTPTYPNPTKQLTETGLASYERQKKAQTLTRARHSRKAKQVEHDGSQFLAH